MKKLTIFLAILFCLISTNAKEKKEVSFSKCTDGDTASVILNKEEIKLRFLAIDTPESVHPTIGEEPFGKDASKYTCNALKNAKKIEIEYDNNSDTTDKYGRHLVWVFIDGNLLQEKLVEEGLAEVAYLYDDYKYTSSLEAKEMLAKTKTVGIWSEEQTNSVETIITMVLIITAIRLFFTNQNFRKKSTNKIKTTAKRKLKKILKN